MPEPLLSKNPVARCIDSLSQVTVFSRGPAEASEDDVHDSWDAQQCLICVERQDQTHLHGAAGYYRARFVAYLSLCMIFISTKLAQAAGNAGTATILGAGGSLNLSPGWSLFLAWSGFAGSVITTAFTRLIAIVEVCSRWFFKDGANTTRRERLNAIASENYLELSPGRRWTYNLIRSVILFCALVTVFFKIVNAGLSGIIEALEWLGRTPEEIAQLKTGNSDYMPDKLDDGHTSFVISWMIVLMVGAAASAVAFDVFREGRIWDKSRDIALSVARWGLGPLPAVDRDGRPVLFFSEPEKKERIFWWISCLLGVVFAMCSVAYAFVSTELALTVYTVWWIGGGYKDAIKWASFAAATTNFPAMMLSAGEDLQRMTKDLFLYQLGLQVKSALVDPLTLICCGYKTQVVSCVKFVMFPIFLLLILIFGLCDTFNNTEGVKGSLTNVVTNNFDMSGLAWTVAEWILAAVSALTYFANNGWMALKIGLYICGMIRGGLFTNMDGVTEVASGESMRNDYRSLGEPLNEVVTRQPRTGPGYSINDNDYDPEAESQALLPTSSDARFSLCCCP